MFETVYSVLYELLLLEKSYKNSGASFSIPGWGYYSIAIFTILLYLGFQVMLYLFMAFGLKNIYRKKGLKTNCFIWIPILQLYALFNAYSDTKIFNMQKAKYALTFLIISLAYYLYGFILDVAYFSGDICYFLFHGNATLIPNLSINSWLITLYNLLDIVFILALCGAMLPFFRDRTKNYVILTLLCVFVPDLFPIFVFAFRKRDVLNFAQYKVIYTSQTPNYGKYERKQENTDSNDKPFSDFSDDEPFADFSNKKTDYSEPFADFATSVEDRQNTTEKPLQTDNSTDTEEEDLFN